jgi:hypothetical protein
MFLGVPDAVIQEIGSELPFSQATFSPSSSSNSRSTVSR